MLCGCFHELVLLMLHHESFCGLAAGPTLLCLQRVHFCASSALLQSPPAAGGFSLPRHGIGTAGLLLRAGR